MEASDAIAIVSLLVGTWATYRGQQLEARMKQEEARMKEAEARAARDLAKLQAKLDAMKGDRDARREYELDARKRLYEECEPLVFQLREACAVAARRVRSLARTGRDGRLGAGSESWMTAGGYYLPHSTYVLLAPIAIGELLRRRLTMVDLTLEPRIKAHYDAAKALAKIRTDAFRLARMKPELAYQPPGHGASNPAMEAGGEEARTLQHVMLGRLENAAHAMIIRDANERPRIMRFGEFEKALSTADDALLEVQGLLDGFHPETRPVLWRVLLAELHIHRAVAALAGPNAPETLAAAVTPIPKYELQLLQWRANAEEEEAVVMSKPCKVAHRYVAEELLKAL